MGQYYVFANVTKSQSMHSLLQKAWEILRNRSYQPWLQLFLVNLGSEVKQFSLAIQNICLKFLCANEDQYPPGTFDKLFPVALKKKLDVMYLSQHLIGEWAGDRLIITGDYSDIAPFPPDGQWKKGNLFSFVYDSGKFSDSHATKIFENYKSNTAPLGQRLEAFYKDKHYLVVNLDKKEYLDPEKYQALSSTFTEESDHILWSPGWGVMSGLTICLTHSTGSGGGDYDVASLGLWAGDRIIICTAEELDDFDSYKDVSNPDEVIAMFQ